MRKSLMNSSSSEAWGTAYLHIGSGSKHHFSGLRYMMWVRDLEMPSIDRHLAFKRKREIKRRKKMGVGRLGLVLIELT